MFILGKKFGGGSFGTIYEGILCLFVFIGLFKENNKQVAIKIEPKNSLNLINEY